MSVQFQTSISTNGQPHGEFLHEHHDQLLEAVAVLRRDVEAEGYEYRGYQVFLNDLAGTVEVFAVYRQQTPTA